MLSYIFRDNTKTGRKQCFVLSDGRPIAVLETYGIEAHLEGFKKHVERVMKAYDSCLNTLYNNIPVKSYSPKKIDGFEYSINSAGSAAILKYRGTTFAQLNMSGITQSMDLALRYIYHVAQSYLKYLKS